jgi:hypothetical protein
MLVLTTLGFFSLPLSTLQTYSFSSITTIAPPHLCPYRERDKCGRTFRSPGEAATHAKEIHEDPTVPCHYAEEFDCHKLFGTEKQATAHARSELHKDRIPFIHDPHRASFLFSLDPNFFLLLRSPATVQRWLHIHYSTAPCPSPAHQRLIQPSLSTLTYHLRHVTQEILWCYSQE